MSKLLTGAKRSMMQLGKTDGGSGERPREVRKVIIGQNEVVDQALISNPHRSTCADRGCSRNRQNTLARTLAHVLDAVLRIPIHADLMPPTSPNQRVQPSANEFTLVKGQCLPVFWRPTNQSRAC